VDHGIHRNAHRRLIEVMLASVTSRFNFSSFHRLTKGSNCLWGITDEWLPTALNNARVQSQYLSRKFGNLLVEHQLVD